MRSVFCEKTKVTKIAVGQFDIDTTGVLPADDLKNMSWQDDKVAITRDFSQQPNWYT